MGRSWLIFLGVVALIVGGIVLAVHLTEARLTTSLSHVSPPRTVEDCQRYLASNFGDVPARTCKHELRVPWVRVTVRNIGHTTAPDFTCTVTATDSSGEATVDLLRPGGIGGIPLQPGHSLTWTTFVPIPRFGSIQSMQGSCRVVNNPPI